MDTPTFSGTVPIELAELGYIPPIIKSYNKYGVLVRLFDDMVYRDAWVLYVDGIQWMTFGADHDQAFAVYSHYYLAHGHVICTGLGFGIREQWIASKPEVTKVTVLEKFKEVIDYHKDIGTKWSDKIEIINCDANDYKGSCDFLSIDHYECENRLDIISNIKKICNNITCESTWFWILEEWIKLGYIEENPPPNPGIHPIPPPQKTSYGGKENDILENYIKIKKYFDIDKLPSLSEVELMKFINMYYGKHDESNIRI